MSSFSFKDKGFTLVELLVAVAVLAALSAVVIPNVGQFIDHGKAEAMQTELKEVQFAMNAGMVENGLTSVTDG